MRSCHASGLAKGPAPGAAPSTRPAPPLRPAGSLTGTQSWEFLLLPHLARGRGWILVTLWRCRPTALWPPVSRVGNLVTVPVAPVSDMWPVTSDRAVSCVSFSEFINSGEFSDLSFVKLCLFRSWLFERVAALPSAGALLRRPQELGLGRAEGRSRAPPGRQGPAARAVVHASQGRQQGGRRRQCGSAAQAPALTWCPRRPCASSPAATRVRPPRVPVLSPACPGHVCVASELAFHSLYPLVPEFAGLSFTCSVCMGISFCASFSDLSTSSPGPSGVCEMPVFCFLFF